MAARASALTKPGTMVYSNGVRVSGVARKRARSRACMRSVPVSGRPASVRRAAARPGLSPGEDNQTRGIVNASALGSPLTPGPSPPEGRGGQRKGSAAALEGAVQLVEQVDQVVLLVLGEVAQQVGERLDVLGAVVQVGLFAGGRQADVDLALVVGVDA